MFHATGLTGWQRAQANEQAAASPVAPPPKPTIATAQEQSEEVAALKDQAADLLRSLQDVQTRLAELEGQAQEEVPAEEPAGE